MIRPYTNLVTGLTTDPNWIVQFQPNTGYRWAVHHIAVRCPSYVSGDLSAEVFIDGTYWCGTSTAYSDAADGTPLIVNQYQVFEVVFFSPSGAVVFSSSDPSFGVSLLVDEVTA